jgi:RNA polymerase-binding protein DksA
LQNEQYLKRLLATSIFIDDRNMPHRGQIVMIDNALARIYDGTYGYCDITGEQIGLKRLEIQPTATLCVEAQEMVERAEQGVNHCQMTACRF